MITTPNLSLIAWNLPSDPYNSEELAENWFKVDQHDHQPGKGARIDTAAIEDQAITSAKLHPTALPDLTIPDGSITTAKLNDATNPGGGVTLAKLASSSVNSSKIVDGSIVSGDLASTAVNRSNTDRAFVQGRRVSFSGDTAKNIVWTTDFGTTSYTVVYAIEATTPAYNPVAITSRLSSQITISMGFAFTGIVHAIGIRD